MRAITTSRSRAAARWCALVAELLAGAALAAAPPNAQTSGGPYVLLSTRIAGGGGAAAGGDYAVNGIIAQHDAAVVSAQGGNYDVDGGIHPGPGLPPDPPDLIFSGGFE